MTLLVSMQKLWLYFFGSFENHETILNKSSKRSCDPLANLPPLPTPFFLPTKKPPVPRVAHEECGLSERTLLVGS